MANTNNQNSFLDYGGLALFWNNVKNVIEDNELVTATALTDLDTRVDTLEEAVAVQIISKTYSELKTLRDNSQLVPGQQYRITDYRCTTAQTDTKSARHVFDIIVTADSESVLNEEARAINHLGDTYFTNCDLNAWKLWYCLDNDTNRFAWADNSNDRVGNPVGRGVIYRMIDEFGNECPYDFKNIQFVRYRITASPVSDLVDKYATSNAYNVTVNTHTTHWCYTFSTTSLEDASLDGYSNDVYNNIIPEYKNTSDLGIKLNDIVFVGINNYGNRFDVNCYNNTFGNSCYYNTFGNKCYNNTFGNSCYSNTFGNICRSNTFGNSCYSNTFGNACYYNTFGNACYYNTFGNACYSNTFGSSYYYNTVGNNCYNNTFGNSCYSNTFGNECMYNTFGNYCKYNTFGNYCHHNTFGNDLDESQFGDGVQYFGITNRPGLTVKPTATNMKNYIKWLIVENGVRYVNAYVTSTTSSSSYCQNVRICQGCSGTSNNYKSFSIDNVNKSSQLIVCYNSSGTLKTGNLGNLF